MTEFKNQTSKRRHGIILTIVLMASVGLLLDEVFSQGALHVEVVETSGHVSVSAVHSSHWQQQVDVRRRDTATERERERERERGIIYSELIYFEPTPELLYAPTPHLRLSATLGMTSLSSALGPLSRRESASTTLRSFRAIRQSST